MLVMVVFFIAFRWIHLSMPFFCQAEDGIRFLYVTGVQTCALPIFNGCRLLRRGGGVHSGLPKHALGTAVDRYREHMLAPPIRCLMRIWAGTGTVDRVHLRGAAFLRAYLEQAIGSRGHMAFTYQCQGTVNAGCMRGKTALRPLAHSGHCIEPALMLCHGVALRRWGGVVRPGIALEVVRCYNGHCLIPHSRGGWGRRRGVTFLGLAPRLLLYLIIQVWLDKVKS